MTGERTALFVCLHGAAMSRLAAAYFNRAAPAGWHAVSAGVEPADTPSINMRPLAPEADALRRRLVGSRHCFLPKLLLLRGADLLDVLAARTGHIQRIQQDQLLRLRSMTRVQP
jgi:hypothetical protein